MKKTILYILLAFLSIITFTQVLFAQIEKPVLPMSESEPRFIHSDKLITLHLELDKTDFYRIYNQYRKDLWISAEILMESKNRVVVRLRIRGDSSRKLFKKSLKIALPKGVRLLSNSQMFNLNAEVSDATFMRQYLATRLFRESGQTCFKTRHVLVNINDTLDGIYLWVENLDKAFLKSRKLNTDNYLYKATRDGANLSLSDDLDENWESKSGVEEVPLAELKKLRIDINNVPDSSYYEWVRKTFDYDAMVNILSMNLLISNSSTYYHNYYMYYDLMSKKWQMWPWDLDKTFCLDKLDMHYHRGSHRERRSASLPGNPILERAIICAPIFHDIQKRTFELQKSIFNIDHLSPIIDSLEKELLPYVELDTKYGQSLASFRNEVEDLKKFIIQRYDSLKYQFDYFPTSFAVHRPKKSFKNDIQLTWDASIDPNGDDLRYNVQYCSDVRFKSKITYVKNLEKPTCIIDRNSLKPGRYYFKVSVSDGKHKVFGYDSCHSFKVK